jgi:hypothetical protein
MGKIKWSHAFVFYGLGAFTGMWFVKMIGKVLGKA